MPLPQYPTETRNGEPVKFVTDSSGNILGVAKPNTNSVLATALGNIVTSSTNPDGSIKSLLDQNGAEIGAPVTALLNSGNSAILSYKKLDGTADIFRHRSKVAKPTAPSAVEDTVATAGKVGNGTYTYKVSYMTAEGFETELSDASASVTVSGGPKYVFVTIPVSPDPRVTKRRIYRTTPSNPTPSGHSVANPAGTYWRNVLNDVADNTSTTFTDGIADLYLGLPSVDNNNTDQIRIVSGGTEYRGSLLGETTTTFGIRAGNAGATGAQCNTLIGALAGANLVNNGIYGNYYQGCTAIGYQALSQATTTETCVAVGANAMWQTTTLVGQCVAVGVSSGNAQTVGTRNLYLGTHAGMFNQTGNYNIYVGTYCGDNGAGPGGGAGATDQSSNLIIGYGTEVPAGTTRTGIIGSQNANGYISQIFYGGGIRSATPTDILNSATKGYGANIAGAKYRISGGASTGSANGGSVVLSVSPSGSSGASENALVDMLELVSDGYFFIKSASTVPASNPTGGGYLYVEAGALKYRGSSGTITVLGLA